MTIIQITKTMWQVHPSVFKIRDSESTVWILIRDHTNLWELIENFIDVLLKVFVFF